MVDPGRAPRLKRWNLYYSQLTECFRGLAALRGVSLWSWS